ncbi:MAG: hypothetical protein JSS29_10865 [Proteobacteria bacterium]|nr:hypothetical protein [Pseudomonadota bacterium]
MLRTVFLMAMSFAISFSATTLVLLVRERFSSTQVPNWREENDLLRW